MAQKFVKCIGKILKVSDVIKAAIDFEDKKYYIDVFNKEGKLVTSIILNDDETSEDRIG